MRRMLFAVGVTATVLSVLGCSSSPSPSAPTQTTTATPQISITPNPLSAVAGPFSLAPNTQVIHPFALSHLVIQYQGVTNVALTVNTPQWQLVLMDGTVGLASQYPSFNFRIPAGQKGEFTYDIRDTSGALDPFMLYSGSATQSNGTFTVAWTHTDDNGNTGTLTASAPVAGS